MPVTQLLGVDLTVADIAGAAAFYRDVLGLAVKPERTRGDSAWNELLGLQPDTRISAAEVAIGRQTIGLVAFDPPGKPYPADRASNDQWFQHLALVCGDVTQVFGRLERGRPGAITLGAPVKLPPNTGRVTAFKFRDPEGHPLELIAFPDGVGASVWHEIPRKGILGYDHTAIVVTDLVRSMAFYVGLLGFRVRSRSLNRGPEQDRLDGLINCEVDVVALEPDAFSVPHIELLHYRKPRGRTVAASVKSNDVASARQMHQVDNLDALVARLRAEMMIAPNGVVTMQDGRRAASVSDPDGHLIVLIE